MTAVRRLITTFALSLAATALLAQGTTPAPRTTESVTAETDQDVNNPRALQLSLDQAIRTSMERNLGVQLQEFEYQESSHALRSQYGIYDLLGTGRVAEISNDRPVTSTIQAASERAHIVNVGVQQNLPTGGNYAVRFNNSRSTFSGGGVGTVNPGYSPELGLTVNQPLLRDFGIDINRRFITIARNTLGLNHETFRTALMDTAVNVEQAYLNLVYARRAVEVVKESLFLARDQARITQIRIDVGASAPLDILQPRVTIATSEEQLIIAVANVRSAEDQLRALLNLDPAEWDRPIIPTDTVEYQPLTISVDEAVRRAIELRPEIRQDRLNTDTRRVQYMYARNQTLPVLDFDLDYNLSGVAGTAFNRDPVTGEVTVQRIPFGRGLQNLAEADFPGWTIGFNVGVPITNIGARAEARRAELDLEQSRLAQQQTRQTIAIDVRQAVRDVDTASRTIVATRAARDAAERNVEAERRRYENGMTTNFQVLEVQQQLSDARVRELQALVGYNQAVARYHRAVGDVLELRNISVTVPELAEEPRIFSGFFERYNWLNFDRNRESEGGRESEDQPDDDGGH
ncbi:MAG TPA: TolC family protein [Thermoanaerobaculia bacterium]|jgi:HAE1 family hydrophobic/amphiphilic exporter-1